MWMQINQAWSQLAERERLMLKVLAGFLLIMLFYTLVWSPVHSQYQASVQDHERAVNEWQWLQEQVKASPRIEAVGQTVVFATQSQLMSTLQKSLRSESLLSSMESMTPTARSIQVTFKKASAPRFFRWLSVLEQQGLVAQQMQVKPVESGWVEASVRFEVSQ